MSRVRAAGAQWRFSFNAMGGVLVIAVARSSKAANAKNGAVQSVSV
jgi:hypothetical protein